MGSEILNPMESMVKKLKLLKALTINWEKNKKIKAKEELVKLEVELDIIYSNHLRGFENEIEKEMIVEKEKRKLVLLRQEEET